MMELNDVDKECADCQMWEKVFSNQHERLKKPIAAWQEAHNKPDVLPDLGELVEWLMEKAGIE